MSHSFHTVSSPQVFLVVSLYTAALYFVVHWYGLYPIRNRTPRVLSALWFLFRMRPLETFRFWITESTTDLHAWSATEVRSLTDRISLPEDLGWVTFMARLMRSDSGRCSRLGDKKKKKPQMSLTPSADYFHWWYHDWLPRLWYSPS